MLKEASLIDWLAYCARRVAYAYDEVLQDWCRRERKPYRLTSPQWGVLALLAEEDGVMLGALSRRRGIDAPTITGIVKRLERSGLVERRLDGQDRRIVRVCLTAEGRSCCERLAEVVGAFAERLVQGLSEADHLHLQQELQLLLSNVVAVAPKPGECPGALPLGVSGGSPQ
jgi:DNA-binding MarR family transcriptional regulator